MSREPTNLFLIELTAHARSGKMDPLAKHIEGGGNLDGQTRDFLAAFLRGDVKFKRGNRRTFAQYNRELKVVDAVQSLQIHEAMVRGARGSRARAIAQYLDRHPNMNAETLKGYLKHFGQSGLVKAILRQAVAEKWGEQIG